MWNINNISFGFLDNNQAINITFATIHAAADDCSRAEMIRITNHC